MIPKLPQINYTKILFLDLDFDLHINITNTQNQQLIYTDPTFIYDAYYAGISQLLNQIETNCRLEHVALVAFASSSDTLVSFTRDIDTVRSKLSNISCQVMYFSTE